MARPRTSPVTRTPFRLHHLAFAAVPLSLWPGLAPAQGKDAAAEASNPLAPRAGLPPGAEQLRGLRIPREGEAATPPEASDEIDAVAEEPPARVGRLARVQGSVAFRQSPEEEWTPAVANTALVAGNALYTEPGARAAIQVNQIGIALEGGTDLQIARLDDEGLIATLPRGSLDIQAAGLLEQERIEVVTAQGRLATGRDGRYLIDAGAPVDAPGGFRPTRFSVLAGEAVVILGEGIEQPLGAGQTLTLTEQGPVLGRIAAPPPLVAWAGGLGGKATQGTPVAARQMTGAEDLGRYGRWESAPEYGDIWYPTVEAGYVPYRDGRWVWRQPWGWTWLDERPWGFAPFHYGRWVQVGPRWGWAPRPVTYAEEAWRPRRPVWAPALVAFVGVAALGQRGPGVGWVPLGPREAYYPAFRASPVYVRNVNLYAVRDPRALEGRWRDWRRAGPPPGSPRTVVFAPPPRADAPFINRAAFSALPAADMTASRPTRGRAQPIAVSATATPVLSAPPPPSGQTLGVTPVVAGRVGLPATTVTVTPRRDGPPPQTHVPLAAVVVPMPGTPRPASLPGSGIPVRPGTAAQAAPQSTPQSAPQFAPVGVAPPTATSPPSIGAVGGVAAGVAAGLGAAAVLGRQPPGAPAGVVPGNNTGRPAPAAFGPAPGVAVQPGTGRLPPPPGGIAPGGQGVIPAPGVVVQPGTGRFLPPPGGIAPGGQGFVPAPGVAVQPGTGRFPPSPGGIAPGGQGFVPAPGVAVQPGTGRFPPSPGAIAPGGQGLVPAPGVAVQPGTGRFPPSPGGIAPGGQGFVPAPGAAAQPAPGQASGIVGSSAAGRVAPQFGAPASPPGPGAALPGRPAGLPSPGFTNEPTPPRTGGIAPSLNQPPPGGKPGDAPNPGATGLRTPPALPGGPGLAPRPQQAAPSFATPSPVAPQQGFRPPQAPPPPNFGTQSPRQPDPRVSQPAAPPPQVFRPQPSAPPPLQQQPAFRPPPPAASPPPPQRQAAPPPPVASPPPVQRQAAPPPPPPVQRQAAPPPPPPPVQRQAAPPPPPPPRRPGDPPGR